MQLASLDYLVLFISSFFFTSILTPVVRLIALRVGVTDKPNQAHKTHNEPVPYLGGIAIVFGTVAVTYGLSIFTDFTKQTFLLASTILVPALLMSIVGLIDDIKQLAPLPRFIAQNALALVAAIVLIRTDTLGTPFDSLVVNFALTMLWLVGITNSINFFDNIDGGASGAVAISSLALTLIAISNGQVLIGAMSAVLAGATIGFLIWNKPPARIYMGDAGALFLGILLATLTIRLDSSQGLGKLGVFIPFLLLAVPVLDTSVAVIKRIHRGISPFQGGRDHLSHRLMRLGLKKRSAVVTLWVASSVFSLLAVVLSRSSSNAHAIVGFAGFVWLLLLSLFLRTKDQD